MPLSDAARALLTGQHAPKPKPSERGIKTDDLDGLDDAERQRRQGFRERARVEDERFRLATDTEYWVAFCFRTPADTAHFRHALGLPDTGHVPGEALNPAVGERPARTPAERTRAMLAARSAGTGTAERLTSKTRPDPLADAAYDGTLAGDAAAELDALHAAFTAPPDPDPSFILDSPHWLAVYWPSREDKETFLADTGLDVLGDKYLDGQQATRILNIT